MVVLLRLAYQYLIHSNVSVPSITFPFLRILSSNCLCSGSATSTTPHSTTTDPAETEAQVCLEKGTQKLEEGDIEGAKALYQRSVNIKRDAGSLFNLGVTHYHLSWCPSSSARLLNSYPFLYCIPRFFFCQIFNEEEFDEAITAWKESIELQPSSPDAHTSSSFLFKSFFFAYQL